MSNYPADTPDPRTPEDLVKQVIELCDDTLVAWAFIKTVANWLEPSDLARIIDLLIEYMHSDQFVAGQLLRAKYALEAERARFVDPFRPGE